MKQHLPRSVDAHVLPSGIDLNLFRGTQPDTLLQRVFGGQVAAQALVAVTVVEPLEAVEVADDHRQLPVGAARAFELVGEELLEAAAVE